MCQHSWRRSLLIVAAMTSAIALSASAAAAADPSEGVTREVVPAERPDPSDEARIQDEIDMLEHARAEAEARRDELEQVRATTEAKEGAASPKAEEARRLAEEAAKAAAAAAKAADEKREAEERRLAAQEADEAGRARMAAQREAEADRIEVALRQAREAQAHRRTEQLAPTAPAVGSPIPVSTSTSRDPAGPASAPPVSARPERDEQAERGAAISKAQAFAADHRQTRVTVLIAMTLGHRGIRAFSRTADPVLCGESGCYVSGGPGRGADLLPLRRALGAGRTLGERAGACTHSTGCIFRGVDLVAYPAVVQPVDMRFLLHDRRQPQVLNETTPCRLEAGQLDCETIRGPDYAMWVVPETLAEQLGPVVLERALNERLAQEAPPERWGRHR
ncbi:MAG: hypothetical protein JSS20_12850 [Proteobacteria bacterium]|nr:hypothetical protein [Pseudomonadota bacterium]